MTLNNIMLRITCANSSMKLHIQERTWHGLRCAYEYAMNTYKVVNNTSPDIFIARAMRHIHHRMCAYIYIYIEREREKERYYIFRSGKSVAQEINTRIDASAEPDNHIIRSVLNPQYYVTHENNT